MRNRVIFRNVLLFFVIIAIAIPLRSTAQDVQKQPNQKRAISTNAVRVNYVIPKVTTINKPGFFRTLFSAISEQWTDTKKTLGEVNKIMDNGFLPEKAPLTTAAPLNRNLNVSTTAAPFKIKRSELIALLRKNFLGIGRLVDIEVNQALEQSEREWPQYRQNLTKEVSRFL